MAQRENKEKGIVRADFFRNIHEAVELNNKAKLKKLCLNLTEPNETCLGRSKGEPRGAFKSNESMVEIFEQLFQIKIPLQNSLN